MESCRGILSLNIKGNEVVAYANDFVLITKNKFVSTINEIVEVALDSELSWKGNAKTVYKQKDF